MIGEHSNFLAIRWLPVKNISAETIPAWAVMKVVGREDGIVLVNKPDGDSLTDVLLCDPMPIPPGGLGLGTRTSPGWVLYAGETPPDNGEEWGTAEGSWQIHSGRRGFSVIGEAKEGRIYCFFPRSKSPCWYTADQIAAVSETLYLAITAIDFGSGADENLVALEQTVEMTRGGGGPCSLPPPWWHGQIEVPEDQRIRWELPELLDIRFYTWPAHADTDEHCHVFLTFALERQNNDIPAATAVFNGELSAFDFTMGFPFGGLYLRLDNTPP